jgi:hypothetical protein
MTDMFESGEANKSGIYEASKQADRSDGIINPGDNNSEREDSNHRRMAQSSRGGRIGHPLSGCIL